MQPQNEINYVEIKDPPTGVPCVDCEGWFKNHTQLKSHMWRHTGEKPFSCLICNRTFTQQGNLKAHQRIHTGERPYFCNEPGCDAKFTQKSNLKAHTKIHTGEKPYKCTFCNSAFRQATNLRTHKAIHTGERPYKCELCSKSFTQKSNLKAHKDRVHKTYKREPTEAVALNLDQGRHQDFYKQFNVLYQRDGSDSFDVHNTHNEIIVEQDEEEYAMEPTVEILIPEIMPKDEPYMFPMEKSEYTHMEIGIPYIKEEPNMDIEIVEGNIDDPYSCQICNNTYLSAGDLRIHQCIKGLRYFHCDLCKDCMPTLAALKNHQASHSEGKKYSCSLCGLIFINGAKLKSHHKLHRKKKNFHSIFKTTQNAKSFRYFERKKKFLSKFKHTNKLAVSSRSVWKLRQSSKKMSPSKINGNSRTVDHMKFNQYGKSKMLSIKRNARLCNRDLRTTLSQHYAVSYKHFLILQRKFILKQSNKYQTDNYFSLDSRINFAPVRRTKGTQRMDKSSSVTISQKKDISPLFMCSECNSYFSSLGHIKTHMEIHRKCNAMKTEVLNEDFESQNVLVITECLDYDEPVAQYKLP